MCIRDRSLGLNHQDLPMFDYMKEIFKETLDRHHIHSKVLLDTNFENYYKRKEDFEEVLQKEPLSKQFKIVEHRIEHTPCPYRAAYNENGEVEAFAAGLMKTIQSWSKHTFLKALQVNQCDIRIADEFYAQLQSEIARNPNKYSMDYIHSFLHLEKI